MEPEEVKYVAKEKMKITIKIKIKIARARQKEPWEDRGAYTTYLFGLGNRDEIRTKVDGLSTTVDTNNYLNCAVVLSERKRQGMGW